MLLAAVGQLLIFRKRFVIVLQSACKSVTDYLSRCYGLFVTALRLICKSEAVGRGLSCGWQKAHGCLPPDVSGAM